MRPLVSILIAAFNAERFIADTIASATAQTYQNVEIIIVDDGSTDSTREIARPFRSMRLRLIEAEHRGASAARNTALAAANGDYVQYLDADDLLAPDKLSQQLRALKDEPERTIASCSWARFYNDAPDDKHAMAPEAVWRDFEPSEFLIASWRGGGMMPNFAWLVPRAVAEAAGPWNEELSVNDDGEYFARVVLASSGIRFVGAAAGFYRSGRPTTLSARADRKGIESQLESLQLQIDSLLRSSDTPLSRRASADVLQRFVYECYPRYADLRGAALHRIAVLGGSTVPPAGGMFFQVLKPIVGWRMARILQFAVYFLGYRRVAVGKYISRRRAISAR